jgi:hypothetical protein
MLSHVEGVVRRGWLRARDASERFKVMRLHLASDSINCDADVV